MSLISKAKSNGAAEVKQALQNLTDRRAYYTERIEEITACYSLSAWAPSAVPKGKSSSFRRLETGAALVIEAKAELAKVDETIKSYIRVLQDHADEVRNASEKIRLMKLRFLDGREWSNVAYQLYGENADYMTCSKTYMRRMFRLYDSACHDIWNYW